MKAQFDLNCGMEKCPETWYICMERGKPAMEFRLLVFDIDGTLTNDKKEVTERTRRALSRAHDEGISLALASGRPVCGVMPLAEELGLNRDGDYVIAFNGGQIYDVGKGQMIFEHRLTESQAHAAYALSVEMGLVTVSYKGDRLITERPEDEYVQIEARINNMDIIKTDDFVSALDFRPVKCLIVGEPKKLLLCEAEAKRRLGAGLSIYRSMPYFLEIMPKGIDKGGALSKIVGSTGLIRQEIMAFGDGMNDLSMIRFAEMGIAMENAEEELKLAADYVTCSNNDDGVADAIERFIFRGR